jgi:hypothetical protein
MEGASKTVKSGADKNILKINKTFADSICTCKFCNHAITLDCLDANCTCCRETDHSMILDGIEGFSSS